jgi:hypothetical protein
MIILALCVCVCKKIIHFEINNDQKYLIFTVENIIIHCNGCIRLKKFQATKKICFVLFCTRLLFNIYVKLSA